MIEIRPWLFVGRYVDALDGEALRARGVGAVLELERPVTHEDITTLFVHVQDGVALRPETIRRAIDFVREQHAAGKSVLVACNAGTSRSPTFATAALKEVEGLKLEDALRAVRSAHPDALPDQMLWDSLREYYDDGPPFWELWQQLVEL